MDRLEKTIEEKLTKEIVRTNEILQDVLVMVRGHEEYISDGKKWRMTVLGLVVTMIVQVAGGLYLAGQLTEKLSNVSRLSERNEIRIDQFNEKTATFISDIREFVGESKADSRNHTSKSDKRLDD